MLWEDLIFDWQNGVSTIGRQKIQGLKEDRYSNLQHVTSYQATNPILFNEIFDHLKAPISNIVFLDIGSGKGRALILAAKRGVKRSIGVDFSTLYCQQAEQNVAKFKLKSGNKTPVEIHNKDIAEYEIPIEVNLFFLFNPFKPDVLDKVLYRIQHSVRQMPREAHLIYVFPRFRQLVLDHGFEPISEASARNDYEIYRVPAHIDHSEALN